jgi:glutaredoxin
MKVVYTKDNCPACIALKAKLRSEGVAFKEVHIGSDISRENFIKEYPSVRTVPFVVEELSSKEEDINGNEATTATN